ncbi:MAG: immunoglobulin domain-containing protein [Verrucomicrobiales bacterium]|nr:immunoglobulin domain-containing protein [Verrucomicrobiales bacterium]
MSAIESKSGPATPGIERREISPVFRAFRVSRAILGILECVVLATVFQGTARAVNPCQNAASEDVEIQIQRSGFYLQSSTGVQPDARVSEYFEPVPSPFLVEATESGNEGFGFPDVSFEGTVSMTFGQAGFEMPALNWSQHLAGFGSEESMASGTGGGLVTFQYNDAGAGFTGSLAAPSWSMPTPAFRAPSPDQIIDPSKPVTFQWAPLVRNPATEVTLFQIRASEDDSFQGNAVFATVPCTIPFPLPWIVPMASDATSISVPSGIFTNRQARYSAHLSIVRFQGERQGISPMSWSMDLTDRKVTAMPLQILGGTTPLVQPRIVGYSQAQTVKEGETAKLFVTAEGSVPLTYQWQKNGVDLLSAEGPEWIIAKAAVTDSGLYRVVVKNRAGSVMSEPVFLTVLPATPVAPVAARLQIDRESGGKLLIVATPEKTGPMILEISTNLTTWNAWRTQQVVAGIAATVSVSDADRNGTRWFVRSKTGNTKP